MIHWIPDKHEVFKNMLESLKRGGKIVIQYNDHFLPFEISAYKVLKPEKAPSFLKMCRVDSKKWPK